jgi:hypothetical protein
MMPFLPRYNKLSLTFPIILHFICSLTIHSTSLSSQNFLFNYLENRRNYGEKYIGNNFFFSFFSTNIFSKYCGMTAEGRNSSTRKDVRY